MGHAQHYTFNGQLVATRTDTGNLTWQASDLHGTTEVSIDATTLASTRLRTDPYGKPRDTNPWPSSKGFLGGTTDPTGLTHLGAREYDPTTGRFTTTDPVLKPDDPQQVNGYTYANNNPTTYSDPTGLCRYSDGDLCIGGGSNEIGKPITNGSGHNVTSGDGNNNPKAQPAPPPSNNCVLHQNCPKLPVQGSAVGHKAAPLKPKLVMTQDQADSYCHSGSSLGTCDGPNKYLVHIVNMALKLGIDPRLLLTILHIENGQWGDESGSYKGLGKQLLQSIFGKGSIGMANMDEKTYNATKRGHNGDLYGSWSDMLGDNYLAINAAASRLADLVSSLPEQFGGPGADFTQEELAAIGYNTSMRNMMKVAEGEYVDVNGNPGIIGDAAASYLRDFSQMWTVADRVVCQSGYFTC